MPMRPYFELFPPGAPVQTRQVFIRNSEGLPDGEFRFVELYCDEPGCDCRRVVVLVWDEKNQPLATINYGWESTAYYAKWSKWGRTFAKEMASATLERFGAQSQYANAFLEMFKEATRDPAYLAKLRKHYAEFRAAVESGQLAAFGQPIPPIPPACAARPAARRKASGSALALTTPLAAPPARTIYQLKITLRSIQPAIWRRLQVPGEITLFALHAVIQTAMGWTNSHLHCFRIGDVTYSTPYPETDFEDSGDESDEHIRLNQVARREKSKFVYEYDFGDSWEHVVLVEKIIAPAPGVQYPVCLAGQRSRPPEDCGGPWGYLELLETLADPSHEDHEEMKAWLGGRWNPEAFDLEAVNTALLRTPRDRPTRKSRKARRDLP